MAPRALAGREASPTAAAIDGRSVEPTRRSNPRKGGGVRGHDAGKKIKGRKRHILTDTRGTMLGTLIHPADIQHRDGAPGLVVSTTESFAMLAHMFADGGYAGDKLATDLK